MKTTKTENASHRDAEKSKAQCKLFRPAPYFLIPLLMAVFSFGCNTVGNNQNIQMAMDSYFRSTDPYLWSNYRFMRLNYNEEKNSWIAWYVQKSGVPGNDILVIKNEVSMEIKELSD